MTSKSIDLLSFRLVHRLVHGRWFPYAFQVATLGVFIALMILGWQRVAPEGVPDKLYAKTNLVTLLVWGIWWRQRASDHAGTLEAPGPLLEMPLVAASSLALIVVATVFALREARLANPGVAQRLSPAIFSIAVACAMLVFGWGWPP